MVYGLMVHGGAGKWRSDKHSRGLNGLEEAVEEGYKSLQENASALDVAEQTVKILENNPNFNAGTGASLNIDAEVEMDASIMDGSTQDIGAVSALSEVKNPVKVARKVLQETDHVMLSGEGALRFARSMGFDSYDPIIASSKESYEKKKDGLESGNSTYSFPRMPELLEEFPELSHGTVGVVVRDRDECYASATSTGGLIMQLKGRVGDTPIPGAGTFAHKNGASSATGQGEQVMRTLVTKSVCDFLNQGLNAHTANYKALREMASVTEGEAGVITIDQEGRAEALHRSPHMPHAWLTSRMTELRSRMKNHIDE